MNPFDAIAPFYDLEHEGLTLDTTMYARLAQRSQGPVLVMGAGTGRVVKALAAQGLEVCGVDSSSGMLDIARAKCSSYESVDFVLASIESLNLERRFGMVIVPFDTFSLLETQAQQLSVLARSREHVTPNGLVVVDVTNPLILPDQAQNGLRRQRFETVENGRLIRAWDRTEVDPAGQRMQLIIRYQIEDEERTEEVEVELTVRWVYRFELEALFQLAGLQVRSVHGDYGEQPYSQDGSRLIVTGSWSEGSA